MPSSRLTAKYQATVPEKIRKLLKLRKGDRIIFDVKRGGTVTLRKAADSEADYLRSVESTLGEWNSEIDDDAYRDL